jgi:predicted ATPase
MTKPENPQKHSIYLRKIKIEGFKAIDQMELEFPEPLMTADPDVFIMGSKNGIGKTSILEACALLFLCRVHGAAKVNKAFLTLHEKMTLSDLLIHVGFKEAYIAGHFEIDGVVEDYAIRLGKNGIKLLIKPHSNGKSMFQMRPHFRTVFSTKDPVDSTEKLLLSLIGISSEPLRLPNFMYFNSYRKIQEGNLEMGLMVEDVPFRPSKRDLPISQFKIEILRAMMGKGELFETLNKSDSEETLDILNGLLGEFSNGKIGKLRPAPDNSIDFRIAPLSGGESFTFDGLSSGQKEIISTLFMIWRYTKDQPGVVLIDEPELHLNAEWHRKFIRHLYKLVPQNQYIIATHSKDIFATVEPERRVIISKRKGDSDES